MIMFTDFISRLMFERRELQPGDAVVSIGDPRQEVPVVFANYKHGLREEFIDVEPQEVWKHDGIRYCDCMQVHQAERIAKFIRSMNDGKEKIRLYVHCEAGVSRSAAVALVAANYAGLDLTRDACYANPHVVQLLGDAIGSIPDIPPAPAFESIENKPLW